MHDPAGPLEPRNQLQHIRADVVRVPQQHLIVLRDEADDLLMRVILGDGGQLGAELCDERPQPEDASLA